jgi:tRNA(Ile)-lysidine synthase
MAMLTLYGGLRAASPDWPTPLVLTVDHGLRAGFAAEAELVSAFCAARNLPHRILVWDGEKPSSGIMAAARVARYRLLAKAAREAGCAILMTAHTLDDRLETAEMRAARGSVGFSGMERHTLLERETLLIRPLLQESRLALRAFLAGQGLPYANDPTNDDPRHERTRIRLARPNARAATLGRAEAERVAAAIGAARFLDEAAERTADGILLHASAAHPPQDRALALRFLAACLSPSPYPASPAIGERLQDLLAHGPNGRAFSAARLRFLREDGVLKVARDPRHAASPMPHGTVSTFDVFCPASLLPLANALARLLDAAPFIMPHD